MTQPVPFGPKPKHMLICHTSTMDPIILCIWISWCIQSNVAKSQNVLATTMFSCILIAFNFPGKKTNTCLTHAWSNQPGGDAWPQDRKQTRPNFARTRNQSAKLQGIPSSRKKNEQFRASDAPSAVAGRHI